MFKSKFLKDNFIFMTSAVLGGLLGYLFHFTVSRQLSVAQYGELQAITSLSIFLGVFSTALSFFIIKYSSVLASRNDREGQFHFLQFIFKKFQRPVFAIFLIYLALIPLLKHILRLSDYLGLAAIGFSIVLFLFSAFYLNAFQGWKKFFALGVIGTASVAVKLAAGWVLARLFATASAVSFSILISAVCGWLLAEYWSRRQWQAEKSHGTGNDWRQTHFSGESFKKSFFQILFFSLALAAAGNIDILIVKNIADAETAGYYAALSILGKVIMWLNLAVVGVLLPDAFSLGYARKPADSRAVLGSYALISFVSLPALAVYYIFSGSLVRLLFGEKYAFVSGNLWLFGLMALFLSLLFLEAKLAMARHDFRSTWFLGAAAAVLAFSIVFHHADLKEIVASVIFSFSLGWVMILGLNIRHRLKLSPEVKL